MNDVVSIDDALENDSAVKEPQSAQEESKFETKIEDAGSGKKMQSKGTRHQRIVQSLTEGNEITRVSIPSHTITDGIAVYEVDVSNKKLRWNLWMRYESFYLLHLLLTELVESMASKTDKPLLLPPFPEKRMKALVDHTNADFILQRRSLLENYLKKVLAIPEFRYYESFINFLTPAEDEEILPYPAKPAPASSAKSAAGQQEEKKEEPQRPKRAPREPAKMDDILFVSDQDEITGVAIKQAQVLKNDHTIFQIHVRNINKRKSFSEWTVLKRYTDFSTFDSQIRAAIAKTHSDNSHLLPQMPAKSFKFVQDHLDPVFIERRRILLNTYLKGLIKYPLFRRHPLTLQFLIPDYDGQLSI